MSGSNKCYKEYMGKRYSDNRRLSYKGNIWQETRLKWGNEPYKYPGKDYEAHREEQVQKSWVGTGFVGLEKWPICLEQTEEDREQWMRWGNAI